MGSLDKEIQELEAEIEAIRKSIRRGDLFVKGIFFIWIALIVFIFVYGSMR